MKPLQKKYLTITVILLILLVPMAWIFHRLYEPQLTLREQQRLENMDPEVADQLLALSLENRFDLTDTLDFIRMLIRDNRSEDALMVFKQLNSRYQDVPGIAFWYATSLRENERWAEAEQAYLGVASLMETIQTESEGVDFTRARDLDIVMAYRRTGLPVSLMSVESQLIYHHLGLNALEAGLADSGTGRADWFGRSESYFQNALSLDPDAMDVRGAYANLLLQMDRPEDSLAEYQWMLEQEPENTGWLESAAVAAAADRKFKAAEDYIRTALRQEERSEWRLDRARYLSWGGQHETALQEIESLISEHPENVDYIRERNQLLLNAGRHRDFLESTESWVARFPDELPLRLERIRVMTGLSRYSEAERECTAVLALAPDHFEAGLLKGEALLWMGQHSEAQEQLRKLEERYPYPKVRKRLAQSYLWGERPQNALPWFRMLNPARMEDLDVVQGYAEALTHQERISPDDLDAIVAIHSYLHQHADDVWPPSMLVALSRVLTRADLPREALDLLRSAVVNRPDDKNLKLELADLLHSLGEFEEADKLYRDILPPTLTERTS